MTTFRHLVKRGTTVAAMAGLALALTAGSARAAAITYTVNEGVVPGANPSVITVNDITGKYAESLTLGAGTFSANLLVNFTSYVLGTGLVASQLDAVVIGGETSNTNLYSMYALVTVAGTFTQSPVGPYTFTIFEPTSSTANIYLDPLRNTVNNFVTATTTSGGADDLLILTASAINTTLSTGSVQQLTSTGYVLGGNYALEYTNAAVVGLGTTYWPTLASLNFLVATASGDVDTGDQGSTFPTNIKGDTDITFDVARTAVPEPASLLLLGTGLLAAATRRRRKQ